MILQEYTAATAEPVSLAELKMHMRMSTASGHPEDDLMKALIMAARMEAETKLNRTIMPTVYKWYIDDFPGSTDGLVLPTSPVSASAGDFIITFYEDASGESTTLAATAYSVKYYDDPPTIYPDYTTSAENEWPDNVKDKRGAVCIQFQAGYTLNASSEPSTKIEPIKTWIKIRAADMYEHRESIVEGRMVTNLKTQFLDGLLDPFRAREVY